MIDGDAGSASSGVLHWSVLYMASEWAVRLAMLVYVPRDRSASAARSWLLLIFLLPWPGLVLYALIGRPYVPAWRRERQARVSAVVRELSAEHLTGAAERPELSQHLRRAAELAQNLGDFPVVGGCTVELITDYQAAVDRLCADIAGANHHVHLLYYIFADDRTGRQVCDALAAAVRRGVHARVLIDSSGSGRWLRAVEQRLADAGVEVHAVLPVHFLRRGAARFDLRNHRKIAVIDGRVGFVGSQNLVDADFKPGIVYHELVARLTGPIVLELQAVFLGDLFLETGEKASEPEHFPRSEGGVGALVQALPSGPGYGRENNQETILSLVHGAERRIAIATPYFVPDQSLLCALKIAALRGVEVHLVVSRQADQFLVCQAQRSYYEEMLAAGVEIHEIRSGLLHAKHLSVDGEIAFFGSSNFDIRSFALNEEISLLVYDRAVVASLEAVERAEFAAADRLDLAAWRRRPLRRQVLQNTARLADVLL